MKIKRLQRPAQGTDSPKPSNRAEAGENRIRDFVIGGTVAVTPFLLLILYFKTMFAGLINPDALDYAQIGRNLSNGQGFVTYVLRPLALTHGNNPLHQPDVTHGPLFPFALSLAFDTFKANDTIVALVSTFFYLLTIPVIYFLGVRMFSRAVGVLAALIFAANSLMLEYASSGLPITLEILLVTLLLSEVYNLAAVRRDQGEMTSAPKWPLLRAGVLCGLLYLTDPIFICVFPVIAGMVIWLFPARRWQAASLFALAFSPVVLWMARNAILTGNPIFGLRGMDVWTYLTSLYPGDKVYRTSPNDVVPGKEMFLALVTKVLGGLGNVIQQAPQMAASWVLAFFLPSLFFRFADTAVNTVRSVMLFCILAIVAMLLFMGVQMPLLTCAVPVLLIFSVAYMLYLGQQARLSSRGTVFAGALFTVAVVYPLITTLFLSGTQPAGLKEADSARSMTKMTQREDVSFSDQPWIVAWYANRPSMWVPADDNRVADLRDKFGVRYLFLTDQSRGLSDAWNYLYTNFQSWNVAWVQRRQNQQPEPSGLTININPAGTPLFVALKGFTSVPPLPDKTPSTVIAALPETRQNANISPNPAQAARQVASAANKTGAAETPAPGKSQTR